MKFLPFSLKALPTIVLWISMLITIGIFTGFYSEMTNDLDPTKNVTVDFILKWLYFIFVLSLGIACLFSFVRFFIRWKRNPRSILQPLILALALTGLLAGTYMSGNGNPLPVPGYEGDENTVFWLKLTDMWLYSLYILLILVIISLFGGIIWSYIKRIQ
jgi:CDP-diglyceride synthetase